MEQVQGAPQTCPACGLLSPPSALRCDCGFDFRTGKGGQTPAGPRGIAGWLILVAIGLCVSPLRLGANLIELVKGFDAAWGVLATPGTPSYHWMGAPLLASEVFIGIVLLGWSVVLIYLFFNKKRSFPRSAITFMVASVVLVTADLLVALMIPAVRQLDHTNEIRAIVQGLVAAAIWIPYFNKSTRVHATFVE